MVDLRFVDVTREDVSIDDIVVGIEIRTVRTQQMKWVNEESPNEATDGSEVEELEIDSEWTSFERTADEVAIRVEIHPPAHAGRFSAILVGGT